MNKSSLFGIVLTILSVAYFCFCLLAATENSYFTHALAVHFFIVLACLLVIRQLVLLVSAWRIKTIQLPEWPDQDTAPPMVSIIIPAFNESAVIEASMLSLLQIDYRNYEIIMVDDGSTDDTVTLIKRLLATQNLENIPVRIIAQSNGGKANALNTGIMHASGEFILCVDSDSRLSANSLKAGLRHFRSADVAAVAGNIVVANDDKALTLMQQLEYLISQNFLRNGLAGFGMVTVIPGPIGLFRRTALSQIQAYDEDKSLFAEDADLTVRLLAAGWQVTSDNSMQAITEAPDTVATLLRQRYRWKRGIFQVLRKNFIKLLSADDIRQPVVAAILVMEGFLLEVLGFGVVLFMLGNILFLGEVKLLVAWLILLVLLDLLTLFIATSGKRFFYWLPLLFIQKLSYNIAMQTWGVLALIDEWRSSKMSWDKVERLGNLHKGVFS